MAKKTKDTQKNFFIHLSAMVEDNVEIGENTKIWAMSHVRGGTKIGNNCIISEGVFIDTDTEIGNNCKIQNHSIIYHKTILEDGVFIGPNVCFTNDKVPRAVNPDGTLKSADDWEASTIHIKTGAAVGGQCTITPGVTIGSWSMAGSGSVITKDIPDYALVYGNPARIRDFVCKCGERLKNILEKNSDKVVFECGCGEKINIPQAIYKLKETNQTKKKIWLR